MPLYFRILLPLLMLTHCKLHAKYQAYLRQGVAVTGRNTTGPPCSVTAEL